MPHPNIPVTMIDEFGRVHITLVAHHARVSTERKTELGRDLQNLADACKVRAGASQHLPQTCARWVGNAEAYAHAAELADAAAEGSK